MLLQVRHTVPMANSWMICRRIERLFDRLKRIRCWINLVLGSFPGPSHLSASETTCKLRDSNCLRVQLLSNVVSKRWHALVNNCVLQGLELRFYFRFCEPQGSSCGSLRSRHSTSHRSTSVLAFWSSCRSTHLFF